MLAAHTKSLGDNLCPGLSKCTCNKDRTSVNCEGKHFTSIPKFPDTTETLYLAQNDFINIPSRSFTGLPNLRTLFLDHNKITTIDPFAFEGPQSLTHLDLRSNEITALVNNSLANIPRLSKLYLSTNKIQSIAVDSFNGTSTLEHINLQSNYLTAIPLLGHQPYLEQVTLDGNRIVDATFSSSHLSCSRKMSIVLSNNDITALTNSTFLTLANTSLSKLYLSSNNIKYVEAGTFSGLNSILSLKLGSNPLDSLSLKQAVAGLAGKTINSLDISGIALAGLLMKDTFSLLQNTSLESLIMRFNAINVVRDNSFSRLKSLTMLDLSQSQITRAEKDAFNGLDQVSTLKLNKNRFVTIPEKLPPSLLFLYLGSNQIRKIPANIFNNLVQLQELRMGNNNILTLETGAFNGLVNLKILYLYNNYIATLPGTIFSPFVRLKKLDLGKNNLKTIQVAKDRFSSLLSLYYLNLADNKCTFLQSDIFKSMKSLKYLHLERNNLGQLIAGQYDGQLFKGLTKLRHIHIMSNNIEYLPSSTFKDQLFLTLLNVNHNSLSNWEPNLFKSTRKLSTFDISFNLITTVKQENFQDLESLQYLNMTGSPFLCNCDLRWFRDWINTRKTKVSNNASYTCYGPNDWRSKPLLEFSRKKIDCLFFFKVCHYRSSTWGSGDGTFVWCSGLQKQMAA